MKDLLSALCLVAVIEGLVLFAMPLGWKRAALALIKLPLARVRGFGAVVMLGGLATLWWLRSGVAG